MNLFLKSILFVSLLFLLSSCNENKESHTATFTTNSDHWKDLVVSQIHLEVFEEIKEIPITVDIEEEAIFEILADRSLHYVFVEEGDEYSIDTLEDGSYGVTQAGGLSVENRFLKEYKDISDDLSANHSVYTMADKQEDDFLASIDEKYSLLDDKVKTILQDANVSESFKKAVQLRLSAERSTDLLSYERAYKYLTKEDAEVSENYFSFLEDIQTDNADLLIFESGRRYAEVLRSKDVNYSDYESIEAYYGALSDNAEKLFGSSLMSHYCKLTDLESKINFGSGIDAAQDDITSFKSEVANNYMIKRLSKTIAPWRSLVRGSNAPNFEAFMRSGEKVQLHELKGKKVYIDVWATWCGPCIREIPSLQKLESDLHDQNVEFVSVSIDQEKDKEKWLDFIKEKELSGVQLMAKGAWESDITKGYNIKGIPRFILIDEESRIISANAPRPSEERTETFILKETI